MDVASGQRGEADSFAITIHVDNGIARIVSCDVNARHFKHRILFRTPQDLGELLPRQLASDIADMIDQTNGCQNIISRPDYQISLPGLVLGGLRMMAGGVEKGRQNVMIRFRHFIGGLAAAFKIDVGFNTPTLTHRERIAVEALVDIIGPSISVARTKTEFDRNSELANILAARLDFIQERADDLSFYLGLLVRYVRDCASPSNHSSLEHMH